MNHYWLKLGAAFLAIQAASWVAFWMLGVRP
jgi:hypothetical protein